MISILYFINIIKNILIIMRVMHAIMSKTFSKKKILHFFN